MRTKKQFTKRILILVLAIVIAFGIMPMTIFAASTSVPGAEGHVLTNMVTGTFEDGYDSTIIVYVTPNVSDSIQYRITSDYGAFAVPEYDSAEWHFAGWKTWYKGSHSGAGLITSNEANPKYDDNENYFTVRSNDFISDGVLFRAGSVSVLKETLWKGTYYLSAIFEPLVTVNAGEGISYAVSGATKRTDNKYSVKYNNGLTIDYSVADGYIVTDVSANYGTNYSDNGDVVSLTNIVHPATVTVNARLKQQKVTFDANGGNGTMAQQSYLYGEAQALTANNFTRSGYTFTGWNTKSDGSGTTYTDRQSVSFAPANDGDGITLYAQWELSNYTVSFDTNGGEDIVPITVTYGEKYGRLPSSAITGLAGGASNWYLMDENGSVTDINITKSTIVSVVGNHTLFMKRSVLSPNVSITLTVPGGISDDYKYYIPGASERILVATVKNSNTELLNYAYQWYKDGTPIEGATSNVLNLDGNVFDSGTYKVEVTATLKDGANIVVTANSAIGSKEQMVKIMHATNTLYYDANGGEGGPSSEYTGGTELDISNNEPTKEHHIFNGWNTKADGSGDDYSKDDVYTFLGDNGNGGCTATLYAQWELVKYTVTYMVDGEPVSTETVEHGKDATLPAIPEKEGYTQTAPTWDKDGKNITADTEINAVYTINEYTITFMNENGVYKTLTVKHGEKVTMPDVPTKDGYTVKWDKELDTVKEDVTVKAVYTEIPKTDTPSSPQTGDNSNMFLWIALLFISGGVVITLTVVDRKKRSAANK